MYFCYILYPQFLRSDKWHVFQIFPKTTNWYIALTFFFFWLMPKIKSLVCHATKHFCVLVYTRFCVGMWGGRTGTDWNKPEMFCLKVAPQQHPNSYSFIRFSEDTNEMWTKSIWAFFGGGGINKWQTFKSFLPPTSQYQRHEFHCLNSCFS